MGLDMYLTRKMYVKDWDHTPEKERKYVKLEIRGKKIKTNNLWFLEFKAAYWRKANHIHKWFVDNVQDGVDNCKPHFVPIDKLKELRDLCLYVTKDNEKAEELLPAQQGFFFGSYDYDDWYFDEVSRTYKELDSLIKNHADDEFYYESSW